MTSQRSTPQQLVEHALASSTADDCITIVRDVTSANLRWANNTLTTNGVMHEIDVTVIAFQGAGNASADEPAVPSPARDRIPHEGGRGLDAVDERGIDQVEPLLAGPRGAAHEDLDREVQRQLLQFWVDLHALARLPLLDRSTDGRIDRRRVAREAVRGERLLHQTAVRHVLVEVQQHQPPLEERPDQELPPVPAGEGLVPVGEDHLGGLGAEQCHDPRAEGPEPRDRAVAVIAALPQPHRIPQVLQSVTQKR